MVAVKTFTCAWSGCGRQFTPAAHYGGPRPKYCSAGHRRNADREKHRESYIPADRRRELIKEAEEGYWFRDPDASYAESTRFVDLRSGQYRPWSHRSAIAAAFEAEIKEQLLRPYAWQDQEDKHLDWSENNPDAGVDVDDRWSATPELNVIGSDQADSYPLGSDWASKGAEVNIEVIRRKDRELYGGLIGVWNLGPTPREEGWIQADEWFGRPRSFKPDNGV